MGQAVSTVELLGWKLEKQLSGQIVRIDLDANRAMAGITAAARPITPPMHGPKSSVYP